MANICDIRVHNSSTEVHWTHLLIRYTMICSNVSNIQRLERDIKNSDVLLVDQFKKRKLILLSADYTFSHRLTIFRGNSLLKTSSLPFMFYFRPLAELADVISLLNDLK